MGERGCEERRVRGTSKLKSAAAHCVMDFSSYKAGCTDLPSVSASSSIGVRREEIAQRHAHLTAREVVTYR